MIWFKAIKPCLTFCVICRTSIFYVIHRTPILIYTSGWFLWKLICFNVSPATGGSIRTFNVSWLSGGHPILDPVALISDANRTLFVLLDMLQSASNLRGSVTITVVNW